MALIPLFSCDIKQREHYFINKKLPDNYMGDFSLMGFVVDQYEEAISLLSAFGYNLNEQEGAVDIEVRSPQDLQKINVLLVANNIQCNLSDVADTFYQA